MTIERLGITPGPWKMFYRNPSGRNPIIAIMDQHKREVVNWMGFDGPRVGAKENRQNARLIAAAPEMLEALILITKQLSKSGFWAYVNGEPTKLLEAKHKASLTIARATGKTLEEVKELIG